MESKKSTMPGSREQHSSCQGLEEWGKRGEAGQRLQTLSYKMNQFWRSNVQQGDYR